MKEQSSQVQLHRDLKQVVTRLNKVEAELKAVLKKMEGKRDVKLERGLKEIKEGKGKLYKSLEAWEADMKS